MPYVFLCRYVVLILQQTCQWYPNDGSKKSYSERFFCRVFSNFVEFITVNHFLRNIHFVNFFVNIFSLMVLRI